VYVDFRYQIIDPNNGNVVVDTPMELVAGYIGAEVDNKTHALTPKMGWMVRQIEDDEKILEKLKEMAEDSFDGIDLRVNRVPEHLSQLKHIKNLSLTFTDKIVLPEWMDKIPIDEFRVKGKISPDEMDALAKRFPQIIIQSTNRDLDMILNSGSSGDPLIVVNGAPFKLTQPFDFRNAHKEDLAELLGVDSDDIEDITVLKDAAATAIWGSRGNNGVIEIKTKRNAMKTKGKRKISGTVSDAAGPLWGANVVEINEQGQLVGATTTDTLGHFTLKVVNPKNKIRISYIGVKTVELDINKKKYNIIMQPANPPMTAEELIKLRRTVNADDFKGIEQTPSTNH
jgi:TonB-dependent SusC/RagA subfamily outer membrane receptor